MDILLVMNPQNSFLSPGGTVYMGEKADILRIRLKDYLSGFSKKTLYFKEKHAREDKFFINDTTHSLATSSDFEVCPDLIGFAKRFDEKTRYSAFFGTSLENLLMSEKIKHVGIVGVETHTSILFTAEELRNRGYDVTVIEPCTASRDDYMHLYAINLMRNFLGVRIGC